MYNFRYSHRLVWLRVGTSNSKPSVIAFYFLSAVEEIKGEVNASMSVSIVVRNTIHSSM